MIKGALWGVVRAHPGPSVPSLQAAMHLPLSSPSTGASSSLAATPTNTYSRVSDLKEQISLLSLPSAPEIKNLAVPEYFCAVSQQKKKGFFSHFLLLLSISILVHSTVNTEESVTTGMIFHHYKH